MPGTRVVIEIAPAGVALWVLRGGTGALRVAAERRHALNTANWSEAWPGVLAEAQKPLADWTAELGLRGHEAEVVCVSPTASVTLVGCPLAAGETAAHRAAELSVAGAGSGPGKAVQITDTATLTIDAPTREPGVVRQCHVLAAGESETSASAVSACVQGAGLRLARLVPLDVASAVRAAQTARADDDGAAVRVAVWVGATSTLVLAASAGRTRFFRSLSTGCEQLLDCYHRPLRGRAEGAGTFTPDRADARKLLEQSGVPTPDTVVEAEHELMGTAVLPALQPVLQRLAVELKQTLRFGIPEGERDAIRAAFTGPGGALPRLAEVVCQMAGLNPGQIDSVSADGTADGAGLARALTGCDLNLLPPEVAEERRLARVRRGMWAGIGSAAALIAMYAGSAALTLSSESRRVQGLAASRAAQEKERLLFERSQAAVAAAAELDQRIAARLGEGAPIAHALAAIAEHTAAGMSLTAVDFASNENGGVRCTLVGQTPSAGTADVADTLTAYAGGLAAVPIFANVKLGGTQRQRQGNAEVQRFELALDVVGLPAAATVAAIPTEAKP